MKLFGVVDSPEDAEADAQASQKRRADGVPQVRAAALRVQRPARVSEDDEQVELPDRDCCPEYPCGQ